MSFPLDPVVLAEKIDPAVTPNFTIFPFLKPLRDMVGGLQASAIVVLVAALIVAAVVLVWSRISGSHTAQRVSGWAVLIVFLGAAGVGGASALILWASGIQLV